jgi:DNA mismatch endonuclease (patch repair protein)
MTDVFTRRKRSEIMARVKGRGNAATEVLLAQALRKARVKGWRRNVVLFGRPDFVFEARRLALFVDGCFWHSCPIHGSVPKSNREFWNKKLTRNRERDRQVDRTLRKLGWKPLRVWQHELRDPEAVTRRIRKNLQATN